MGIELVAIDSHGKAIFCESVKWLRDEAPHELFYGNLHAMKDKMMPSDVRSYRDDIDSYLAKLHFQEANPEDEDDYNKWITDDKKEWIDDWLYWRLKDFSGILSNCCEKGLSAYWSY
jgi:hypothetical protein